jgi:F0F1-type ATP synthase assembly protein I
VEAVFAIPVGVGFGWFADDQFESAPIGILVGAGIGFAAFVLRLVRLTKDVQAETATAETPPTASGSSPRDGDDDGDDDDDWGEDHRTH